MKTYSTLILIIFLLNVFCISAQEPPKGTYKIIIKNNLTKDDNFLKVGQTLIENDFQIANKDKEFYTIGSGKKHINKSDCDCSLDFVIKDSCIIVTGKVYSPLGAQSGMFTYKVDFFRIENKGIKSSGYRESFTEMLNIAKLLGGELEYITDIKQRRAENDDIYY